MHLTEFIRRFGTEVLSEQRWSARVGLGSSDVRTTVRPSTSCSSQSGVAMGMRTLSDTLNGACQDPVLCLEADAEVLVSGRFPGHPVQE